MQKVNGFKTGVVVRSGLLLPIFFTKIGDQICLCQSQLKISLEDFILVSDQLKVQTKENVPIYFV